MKMYDKSQNRSYSQDMRKWSAELINHPITHQRLIDWGFETEYWLRPNNMPAYTTYRKGRFGINYDIESGFSYNSFIRLRGEQTHYLTHESQLRQLYLMFTGFELNKL